MRMFNWKRQHPSMILIEALRNLVYSIPPVIIFIISIGENLATLSLTSIFLILFAILVLFLIKATTNWYLYKYSYDKGYFHIKRGLLFKKERSIKKERVQSVNVQTNILKRLLGVASVQVVTAGGGADSELHLIAVTMAETKTIKSYLENGDENKELGIDDSDKTNYKDYNEYRMSFFDLFLAGATSGRFMLLFSIIAALFSQFYPYIPEEIMLYLVDQITPNGSFDIGIIIIILLGLFVLSWIVSTVIYVIQYTNFTVRRFQDDLTISWGIIEQKEFNVNINRVQALVVKEEILRQPLGLSALNIEVAGGASKEQNFVTILFPLLRVNELKQFLNNIIPEYELPSEMTPLPKRSRKRYAIRATLPFIIVLVFLGAYNITYLWIGIIITPLAIALGISRYLNGKTSVINNQLTIRFRNINRYMVFMKKNHIQALELSRNIFQNRSNLFTLKSSVLSSPTGKDFKLKDIENEQGQNLWHWFSR